MDDIVKKKVVVAKKRQVAIPIVQVEAEIKTKDDKIKGVDLETDNQPNSSLGPLPTYPNLFSESLIQQNQSSTTVIKKKKTAEPKVSNIKSHAKEKPKISIVGEVIDQEAPTEQADNELEIDEPIKKKRGRKPKVKSDEEITIVKIPKKRGRKPKIKILTETEDDTSSVTSDVQIKKRGRKPKDKTYSLVKPLEESTSSVNVFENDSYLVTLKITSNDLKVILHTYNQSEIDKDMAVQIDKPEANSKKVTDNYSHQPDGPNKYKTKNSIFMQQADGQSCFQTSSSSYSNNSSAIPNELAFYLENHFNFMYSSFQITNNHKPVMPKVNREDAVFSFGSRVQMGGGTSSVPINSHNLSNLTKVDVTSQLSGQWIDRRINDLLPSFKTKNHTWPKGSPYACWNCTYTFDGPPIGIPDHIEGDVDSMDIHKMVFYLYGNFCSTNCAARHLFETDSPSTVWEKYSLLNVLHCLLYNLDKIVKVELAPVKLFLEKFGGYMSIEKYRAATQLNRKYQMYIPPMIPILFQMEESANNQGNETTRGRSNKKYIPVDQDKVDRVEKQLKIKRLAPIRGNTLTIDKCMNMNIKT